MGENDQSSRDRLTILVIVGIMTEAHSFRSQVPYLFRKDRCDVRSESDCLLGLLNKILETSYSDLGLKQGNQEELPVVKVSAEK